MPHMYVCVCVYTHTCAHIYSDFSFSQEFIGYLHLVEVACVPDVPEEHAAFDAEDGYNILL
jgi:hypothetical protein